MELLRGIAVSPGIVIGRVLVLGEAEQHVPHRTLDDREIEPELERLGAALDTARRDLVALRDRTARELGDEPAKIFEFHIGLLGDRSLVDPIRRRIREKRENSEAAVAEQFKLLAAQFRSMGNEVFRQKANDVIDLDRRVLNALMGADESRLSRLSEPAIIVAHELTPSQTAGIQRDKVLGVAIDLGGRTSHTSIVARALEIPAVVGCQRLSTMVEDGDLVIIDGDTGTVVVKPDEGTVARYRLNQERLGEFRRSLRGLRDLPCETRDGTRIRLLGNIEFPHESDSVLVHGGDGVGLYRTEFLFLTGKTEPSEEDHFEAYRSALARLEGRPLTIRTLDLGADKYTQQRAAEPERNPFLGLRSIRYCLQYPDLFKTQLRAILRASALGDVRVMFPLISTIIELRQARMVLADVMEDLLEHGIAFNRKMPVGMMVETPAAVVMLDALVKEVDFVSVGTNDLIQYTLAVDRGNKDVAELYNACDPAVLRLLRSSLDVANAAGVPANVCGQMSGSVMYTQLLLGLGLRHLSVPASAIPEVKQVIRSVSVAECRLVAEKALAMDGAREVKAYLRDQFNRRLARTVAAGDAARGR